jgi:hypothetical protein
MGSRWIFSRRTRKARLVGWVSVGKAHDDPCRQTRSVPCALAHPPPTRDLILLKPELADDRPEPVGKAQILRTQYPNRPPPEPAAPIRGRSEPNLRGIACRDVPPCRDTWPHDQGRSRIPISCLTFRYLWPYLKTGLGFDPRTFDQHPFDRHRRAKFKGSKTHGRAGRQGQLGQKHRRWSTLPLDTKFSAELRKAYAQGLPQLAVVEPGGVRLCV